jgi:tRNA U34 2-thiouridine synthase MnmA/TrmU
MSQRKETMPIVQEESGAQDLLLRPLCAKHLPTTRPESEGWVDREKLLDFSGRTRKPQMLLAKNFGFNDYATPAGGCCFLTDKQYSDKLVDMWESRGSRDYQLDDLMMLKVGRHIRPNKRFKMIVAREEGEVKFLEGYRNQYANLYTTSCNGPLALIDGEPNQEDITIAAKILARYSQGRNENEVKVEVRLTAGVVQQLSVNPFSSEEIDKAWLV